MTRFALVTVAGASLLVGVVGATVTRPGDGHPAPPATVVAAPPPVPQIIHAAPLLRTKPRCTADAPPFDSVAISVAGVIRRARVMTPPRDAQGIPGTPPLNNQGKNVFAWDRAQGISPGDPKGNVLLNAHTWPDGSALGNQLLAGLQTGDRIVVAGSRQRLCYRVTERVEVLATDGLARYYDTDGPPQLAIVVCSGRRTGPGVWTHRTVWFASPSA